VFNTYGAPGDNSGTTTTGDIVNMRLIFEHILNDRAGFTYNIEVSTLHGLTWRADGHDISAGQRKVAVGCLFTVAGQNAINATYPNLSVFWMWDKSGKIVMR